MENFDFIKALELFKNNPILMIIAFILIVLAFVFITYKPKNKIGNIKSKNMKLKQTGLKNNEVGDIESDKVDIEQG